MHPAIHARTQPDKPAIVMGRTGEAVTYDELAREHIAGYKCPKRIDFLDELPRLPTGKLYKQQLRDQYWAEHDSRI